ncbi:MAG: RNA chaperone Hfq [Pseudomonadota bacterium]|nr:RNA chaperone Hfq [Pseudomonadota bacterium]
MTTQTTPPAKSTANGAAKPPAPAIQSNFLASHRGTTVHIRMTDGKVMVGELRGYDTFTLLIRTKNGREVLVYKQALAYIMPHEEKETP